MGACGGCSEFDLPLRWEHVEGTEGTFMWGGWSIIVVGACEGK